MMNAKKKNKKLRPNQANGETALQRSDNLLDFLDHLSKTSFSFEGSDFRDLDARNSEGETVLHKAIFQKETEVVRELIQLGVQLNIHGDLGFTPLHCAVLFQNLEAVKALVTGGADINSRDEGGCTPLHIALEKKNLEVFRYLVESGAGLHCADNFGTRPIDLVKPGSAIAQYLRTHQDRTGE